jgi:hypothetical protein
MNSIRVALPGYNALTDTDPNHFSLLSDADYVLIKEKQRASVVVTAGNTQVINHNLGYVPFFTVYSGAQWINGYNIYSALKCYATTTTLVLINNDSISHTFKYYIFYDQQV